MKTTDLLLEIGAEEIPAWMIPRACEDLKHLLEKHLSAHALLQKGTIQTFGAPRRLAAVVSGIPLRQEDRSEEIIGPPRSVAYDHVGTPTRAALSFAEKQGVPVSKLQMTTTPRGEYLAVRKTIAGRPAAAILSTVLPHVIQEIPWPKTMHWVGLGGPHFIRPIRWIVAMLGGKVVPFAVAGVHSGSHSAGHRFLGHSRVALRGGRDYVARLKRNGVLVQPADRRRKVETEIHALLRRHNLRLHADPELLEQVTYLNEFPSVILGGFDPEFLDLPREVLITVMRGHQKYFAVEGRHGELAAHFLAVINLDRDRAGLIRQGHERVLRSRFADARFFWQHDLKRRLADNLARLAHVTYESRLGSYKDKVERLRWLARWTAQQWFDAGVHQSDFAAADRAAELCKCDLVTDMVREFTELQGIVGGLYAHAQEEPEVVSQAVYDHYRPAGPDDDLPRNLTGCAVSIADKVDALAGCFSVGIVPSGSSDPYALRRAASGVVRILAERKLPLSLSALLSAGLKAVEQHPPKIAATPEVERKLSEFVLDRVRFHFRDRRGFAADEVSAVLAAGADLLTDVDHRLTALQAIRKTRNFEPLAAACKRIRKILEKAGPPAGWRQPSVRQELLEAGAERSLYDASRPVLLAAADGRREGKYREALLAIANLRPAVDAFFDHVLVNAPDLAVRHNRLTLLAELLREFSTIADFSEIVVEKG